MEHDYSKRCAALITSINTVTNIVMLKAQENKHRLTNDLNFLSMFYKIASYQSMPV